MIISIYSTNFKQDCSPAEQSCMRHAVFACVHTIYETPMQIRLLGEGLRTE